MSTTKSELRGWFDYGVESGLMFMMIVCDSFDHSDYPVYAASEDTALANHAEYSGKNMQRVMEVYDLRLDRELQMAEHRAQHLPVRT